MIPSTGDVSHGTMLSDGLRQLQLKQLEVSDLVGSGPYSEPSRGGDGNPDNNHTNSIATGLSNSHVHDGYGFRAPSGVSTPLTTVSHAPERDSPLPDPHGLGWPGKLHLGIQCRALFWIHA
jgi:GTP cyclohydrolase IA